MLCITISKNPNSREQGRRPCERPKFRASKAEGRKLRRSRNFASALNPVDNYFRKISQLFLRSKWVSSLIWNLPLKFFWVFLFSTLRKNFEKMSGPSNKMTLTELGYLKRVVVTPAAETRAWLESEGLEILSVPSIFRHLEKILKSWADPRIVSSLTLRKNFEKMTENGYLKRVIVAPATDKLVDPQVFQIWHLEKIRKNWADPRIKVTSNEWPADTLTEQRYLKRVIVTPATEIRAFIHSWKCVLFNFEWISNMSSRYLNWAWLPYESAS